MKKIGLLILLPLYNIVFAQDLIINEWSQGASGGKEWVEILTVTDNINIQNYKLIDGNGTLDLVFSGSGFQNIKMGTLIVLYNGGDIDATIIPDLNYNGISDKSLQISSLNNSGSWSITRNSGWVGTGAAFSNTDITDVPQLVNNSSTIIFTTPQFAGANSFAYYISNTASGSTLASNWGTGTPSSVATPATCNGGANTIWINTILPIELSLFSASVVNDAVQLKWKTATEVNNYGFEILRQAHTSTESSPIRSGLSVTDWEKIGFVNGNGNSNSPKSYSFTDRNVNSGKYSYRLKQIDNDGTSEYSKTVIADLGAPTKFELNQNYPNPFNPTTTISYDLPEAANVKLTIFNILGQEIATLVDGFKEAGNYSVNFDADDLDSGLYIYKLQAGSQVQTKKMTLLK